MGRYTWRIIPPEKIAEQDAIQKQLERWRQVFSAFVMSESLTAIDLGAAQVLRLQHLVTTSFVGVCLRNDEKKTDEWNQIYEQVVDLAEAIEDSRTRASGDASSPNFLFDMEIVSPLWLVMIKCRHPVTRRRAIDILRRTKRREGLWDSQVAAIVGERMMLLEEKNLTVLDGSELPEECDRLHASHIATHPVSYAESQKHIVTHFYKPDGLDGRWAVLYEEIELS